MESFLRLLDIFLDPLLGVLHHSRCSQLPKIAAAVFQLDSWFPLAVVFNAKRRAHGLVVYDASSRASQFVLAFYYNDEKIGFVLIVDDDEISVVLLQILH